MLPLGPLPVVEVPQARAEPRPVHRDFPALDGVVECRPGLVPVVAAALSVQVRTPWELAVTMLQGVFNPRPDGAPALHLAELLAGLGPLTPGDAARLNQASRVFQHEFAATAALALLLSDATTRLPPPPPPVADRGAVGGFVSVPAPRPTRAAPPRLPMRRRAR
ncbi:MAG: hypothetical protein SFW67_15810 [Myxococcaceae bacterium]|nr:hypothetical protein [Myxococcaceae bacterium]